MSVQKVSKCSFPGHMMLIVWSMTPLHLSCWDDCLKVLHDFGAGAGANFSAIWCEQYFWWYHYIPDVQTIVLEVSHDIYCQWYHHCTSISDTWCQQHLSMALWHPWGLDKCIEVSHDFMGALIFFFSLKLNCWVRFLVNSSLSLSLLSDYWVKRDKHTRLMVSCHTSF